MACDKKRIAVIRTCSGYNMRTHFLLELNRVGGGLDKVFTLEKVVPPARVNLPAEVTQLAPFFELSRLPETSSQPHVNGRLYFVKK